MLKHQRRKKDIEERIKEVDAGKKKGIWFPLGTSTSGGGLHGRICKWFAVWKNFWDNLLWSLL